MNKRIYFIMLFVFALSIGYSQTNLSKSKKFDGYWSGNINVGATELELVIKVKHLENDSIHASLDSPDQGVKDIAVSEVIIREDSLIIKVKKLNASYKGHLINDSTMEGSWKQSGKSFPLNVKKVDKINELRRPQEPKPPYPYLEQEVSFMNKKDNITLGGTLTYPKGNGPFITVVMVTGSGQQNRDEELMGHKPFKVIADFLTRNGIAVLRIDDRGIGTSGGNISTSTTFDFVKDINAAIAFVKKNSFIKASHIGIIGHSEGGLIAPIVASENKKVSFIVLMAGTGVTGSDIILTQSAQIAMAMGKDSASIAEDNAMNKDLYKIATSIDDNAKARTEIEKLLDKRSQGLSQKEIEEQGLAFADRERIMMSLLSPWFKTFLKTDPATYLVKVKCPVLAMNGAKDLQVDANINLPAIENALKQAKNNQYTIKKFDGLNHLFQLCDSGLMKEYSRIEETIHLEVLEYMLRWINDIKF